MKKKTSSKSGKSKVRQLSKKKWIIGGLFGALLLIVCAVFFSLFAIRQATTVIGFYDIPETYIPTIESLAMKENPLPKTKFIVLSEKAALSPRLSRKVDILVTWNSALTAEHAVKAMPLSSVLRSRYPSAITGSPFYTVRPASGSAEFRVMPILFDNFETSYFKVLQKKTGQKYPETLSQLESYAAGCKAFIENPLICAGANDDNLYSMISVVIESLAGQKGYVDFINQIRKMRKTDGIDQLLSLPIGGDAPQGTTFASALDRIKQWQKLSLILPEWYKASERTVSVTMEDNHAAVVFMSLREHREKPFPAIKYFQGNSFPPETSKTRAVVEASICAMIFRDTESAKIFMGRLSSEAGQEALSVATKLGPAALRGEAFDIQADDARYYAAATIGGPVPNIGIAAFKDTARRSAIATDIRAYLARN